MFHKLRKKIQHGLHSANIDSVERWKELEINAYGRQLSDSEIEAKEHRAFVGGLWEEVGQLQFEFLKAQGLLPEHKLVDVGCGAMRGGLHFVDYLQQGNYFGLDINESLIRAAKIELDAAGLLHKNPNLLVNDKFEMALFGAKFDFAVAVSVFTHLFVNNIVRCLVEVNRVLAPGGRFYATFFEAPNAAHLDPIHHNPGNITTHYDRDPFHYAFSEMQTMADLSGLQVSIVEEWSHPRNQRMLCFSRLKP